MNKYLKQSIPHLAYALMAAIVIGIYSYASVQTYRIGFPLDDAWIHQTYARNLAEYQEWAFLPHQPSAGSTAPLWSAILALGYLLHINPYLSAYFWGWLLLWGMAELSAVTLAKLRPAYPTIVHWLGGALIVLEWHLVWAAMSGMETLAIAFIVLLVICWLVANWGNLFWLGFLIGMGVWIRPDALTLLGPVGFTIFLGAEHFKNKILMFARLIIGFVLTFGSYLYFNWRISATWWPNTLFAKQAEYAIERLDPIYLRLGEQFIQPLVGVGVLLIPGLLVMVYKSLADRKWAQVAWILWFVGYLTLYALRLPVVYQHGRYQIPAMPVIWLWSYAGSLEIILPNSPDLVRRIFSRTWVIASLLVLMGFVVLGARAYGKDVAVIESEMVDTAIWVSKNTPKNALIAAHDIGALGYWGEREIVDLAGLISPEVIPVIRLEPELANFMNQGGVNYLMTFPGWYPYLTKSLHPIYTSEASFSPDLGGENMVVYCWLCDT